MHYALTWSVLGSLLCLSAPAAAQTTERGAGAVSQTYLKASNTGAFDQFGDAVAVARDTVVVGAWSEDSSGTGMDLGQGDNAAPGAGAAYVFVRHGPTWAQQAYLKASNSGELDGFGISVAVSGDTLVVGAWREDSSATGVDGDESDDGATDSGAAYVFVRNGPRWTQQAYLKASNTGGNDRFGRDVAVCGDTIVVGAPSENSSATGVDGDGTDNGAPDAGAAYVFVRQGTMWSQQAYLKASDTDPFDRFGHSVAVDGDTVVVGAYAAGAGAPGAAYVFERSGTSWSQQGLLLADNGSSGDRFGEAVAASGDIVVVGAPRESSDVIAAGAAYVFERHAGVWSQQAWLKGSDAGFADMFGQSVGVSGDTLAAGAPLQTSGGAVYEFRRLGGTWGEQAQHTAVNADIGDEFGIDLALDAGTLVAGAQFESSRARGVDAYGDNNSATNSGAAYIFEIGGGGALLLVGDGPGNAWFLDGDRVLATGLDVVLAAYPVGADEVPEFVLPLMLDPSGLEDVPAWMHDGEFAVELHTGSGRSTAGLYVAIGPDGTVHTTPFGTARGGLALDVEERGSTVGRRTIRFSATIP